MKIEGEGQLLRVFVDENDQWEGRPLYEAIIRVARAEGLAGATVLRGMMGYGSNSLIHSPQKSSHIPEDLPVVIEIVESSEKIKRFLPTLDRMVREGLVTIEKATVIFYRTRRV